MKPVAAGLRAMALASALLATIVTLRAQLTAYDGFESYAAGAQVESGANGSSGTGLNGGAGWGGAYDVNNAFKTKVLVENRTASPVIYNNGEIHLDGGARALRVYDNANGSALLTRALGTSVGGAETVFVSFLFRTNNASPLADQDFFQMGFDESGATNPRVSVGANTTATAFPPNQPYRFFARSTTSTANSAFDNSTEVAAATTYLLVGKVSGGIGNFNRVDMFVNPSTLAEPATASATITLDSGVSTLSLFLLRTAFLDVGDAYVFDEFRVGSTFASVVSADGDGDGIPDAWELSHGFDALTAADAIQDADGDGSSNISEYRAGTNPRSPLSRFHVTEILANADSVGLTWTSVPGRRYHLQFSDDLVMWTTLSDGGGEVTIEGSPGEVTAFTLAIDPSAPARFFRVEVLVLAP